MVEIPSNLRVLWSAPVEANDDRFYILIPTEEVGESVSAGGVYHIALLHEFDPDDGGQSAEDESSWQVSNLASGDIVSAKIR